MQKIDEVKDDVFRSIRFFLGSEVRKRKVSRMRLSLATGLHVNTLANVIHGKNTRLGTVVDVAKALGYRMTIGFEPLR